MYGASIVQHWSVGKDRSAHPATQEGKKKEEEKDSRGMGKERDGLRSWNPWGEKETSIISHALQMLRFSSRLTETTKTESRREIIRLYISNQKTP
jgi:hypothetical protein